MPQQTSYQNRLLAGFAGQLYDVGPTDKISRVSAEVALEMPFGIMAAFGVTDNAALLPVGAGAKMVGVVLHSHSYPKDIVLGMLGLKPKACLSLLRKGRCWVTVEQAVAPADPVFIRHTAGAGGTQLGAFRKDADTATATDLTKKGVYLSTAAIGGLALVEIDMTNG